MTIRKRLSDVFGGMGVEPKSDHPAKFSPEVLQAIDRMLDSYKTALPWPGALALDPFAGTGGVLGLVSAGGFQWTLSELEPEWALEAELRMVANDIAGVVLCQDWLKLGVHPSLQGSFHLVVTSPAYGNRMADKHQPSREDTSRRITYRHRLGRPLTEGSAAGMQWGDDYRAFHEAAWERVWDVLVPGGLFVLNVSDHVRGWEKMPVSAWHEGVLREIGFQRVDGEQVVTRRMKFGANADARVEWESVIVWRKP